MGRSLRLALLLCLLAPAAAAQRRAEVVVIGPGDDVFSTYGHAAILLVDPRVPRFGRLYNFGITNFNRPNYITDFLTGKVFFWGKSRSWLSAVKKWKKEDRTVTRYPLNLTESQLDLLVSQIQHDVHPKFRDYVYDTFRENCSTRIRDYLDTVTRGAVYRALGKEKTTRSYHDEVRIAFSEELLLQMLTEIVPGIEMDKLRTPWELSFLPMYLGEALRKVEVEGRPLTDTPIIEHTRVKESHVDGSPYTAQAILLGFALLLSLLAWRAPRWGARTRGLLSAGWIIFAAALGGGLLFIHSWTAWPDMREGFVMIAFLPLDAFLLITAGRALLGGRVGVTPQRYLKLRLGMVLLLLALQPFVDLLRGSAPPRIVAAAGLFFLLRALSARPRVPVSTAMKASR
ncbi:DUF4105 domain-containing protein [Myxococcota bacterium]|nr:DUF4105 domain-containing protein [Myxococcota bacterium]MBU1429608.1 DUF4105 domain-containing protein [Myxococcota bacterium]MBU1897414.1 DUF4105 domain-containing protein [Myxococcota bacterium]